MSKALRTHLLRPAWPALAVGVAILLAPVAQAEDLPWNEAQLQPQQPLQAPPSQQPQAQPPSQQQQQAPDLQQIFQMQKMQMRARVAGAIQQLRNACGEELRNFCSTVTPGEARLLLCMQAHEDKISRQCELALLETTRNIGSAVRKVENLAQACWQDIQTHCSGTGGSVVQCMIEKRASLSPQCQAIVAASAPPAAQQGQAQGQTPQGGQMTMVGLPIYSADGMMLGQVTGLRRRSDGGLEAIEADVGTPLGLGATSVLISPGELRWRGDGVELQMMADQVRSVLQGQQQRR